MITRALFDRIFPTKGLSTRKYNLVRERDKLIDCLNRILPKYGINNYLRVCAFFANCGIETDYFKTTVEYASGEAYEGRAALGNTQPFDGKRFKGRGLTQTTGRYNYRQLTKAVGREVGIDFVDYPERLAEIEIAVLSACVFWKDHNLNAYADRGQFKQLSAIVNRGDKDKLPLHWSKRNELYSLCKRRVPADISFAPAPGPIVTTVVGNSSYTTQTNEPAASPSPQPSQPGAVVLTPTETGNSTTGNSAGTVSTDTVLTDTTPTPDAAGEKSAVKQFSEKYLKHCPSDTLKNILAVVAVRFSSTISTVWAMGLSGKILLIVAGASLVGFSAYALYYYAPRIWGWITDIGDSIVPNEQQQ